MVQFLLKLLLKRFLTVYHNFHLILIARFHYLYVKESEILERSESGILESRIFYLGVRNPV